MSTLFFKEDIKKLNNIKKKGRKIFQPFGYAGLIATTGTSPGIRAEKSADSLELVSGLLSGATISGQFEADLLTFVQIIHSSSLDGADMDENVGAAIIRLDEAEALASVKPLDSTNSHDRPIQHKEAVDHAGAIRQEFD